MSIAAASVGEQPIAGHNGAVSATATKPPRRRQLVAKSDTVTDPEAR